MLARLLAMVLCPCPYLCPSATSRCSIETDGRNNLGFGMWASFDQSRLSHSTRSSQSASSRPSLALDYLVANDLLPRVQSAYRKRHSTETALLRVWSDILTAADWRQVTLLGLLDMSSAFD